ncbi:MAG: hypothetical protein J6386_00690 [Candidatus Synoicihabitans palmerolidicus]|nr:hypothetical protein [Candidatus Synoicihabitans palmerolidicus]
MGRNRQPLLRRASLQSNFQPDQHRGRGPSTALNYDSLNLTLSDFQPIPALPTRSLLLRRGELLLLRRQP